MSVTGDGTPGNDHSEGGVFSADGRYLAFVSFVRNLLGETAQDASQVLVWDRGQDGTADFDGDGMSDAAEYVAGTDPKDRPTPRIVLPCSGSPKLIPPA